MKHFTLLTCLLFLMAVAVEAQNNTGNPWGVWYPELGATGSNAPDQAFAINASTGRIYKTASNSKSYTIGNDLRGYVYYQNINNGLIYILDPATSTGGTQTPIGSFSPFQMITGETLTGQFWVHSIHGFYISATNKHYIALVGYSDIGAGSTGELRNTVDVSDALVSIFDVTNPASITLTKKITANNVMVKPVRNIFPAPTVSLPNSMVTGMVLHQSAYTSAATKMFLVIEDAIKAGSTNTLGAGSSGNDIRYPGIWIDIVDPLNPALTNLSAANVHETAYDNQNMASAIYPTPGAAGGSHQIAYDPTHDVVYITQEDNQDYSGAGTVIGANKNPNKILGFHASTPYNPTYVIYRANSTAFVGFHGLYVNRAGTKIYTGRNHNAGGFIPDGEDRAHVFDIVADKANVTAAINNPVFPSASSPSFSGQSGYFKNGVKCTNLTPDESYLYSSTYGDGSGGGTPLQVASIWQLNTSTLQVNQRVQTSAGANATFNKIDPHSYAFTLSDFGDAPLSYGTAGHNLVNLNYVNDLLRIGSTVDGDTEPHRSTLANGDDNAASPRADDEDGITTAMADALPGLYYGMTGTYSINNVTVRNATPNAATLVGWIDFNHDGVFQQAEATAVPVPINSTSVNLNWTIPANVTSGKVILRLRISTDASLTVNTPTGFVMDGEAEDFIFAGATVSGNVFVDANNNTIYGAAGAASTGEAGYISSPLYAYLIHNGIVVDVATVQSDGSYTFANAPQNMGAGSVEIGTNNISAGSASSSINNISAAAPSGFVYSGSSSGTTTNGSLGAISLNISTAAITNLNFGLRPGDATGFNCSNLAYQVAGPNPGTSTLYSYNVATGVRTLIADLGVRINNIGYNGVDNMIWGYNQTNPGVIRVDATGASITVAIPNLPAATTGVNDYFSGTVLPNGYLLLLNGGSGTHYYVVDINPSRSTYLQLVDPTAGYVLDTAPFGTALSSSPINAYDLAYDASANLLRGVVVPGGGANAFKLVSLDPTTGAVSYSNAVTGVDFQSESTAYGSVFTDPTPNTLYVFANALGKFYRVNTNTATATLLSTSLPAANNDGANCPTATLLATSLSGNVFNDGNGLIDGIVNQSGPGSVVVNGSDFDPQTSGAQLLYATLVSGSTAIVTVQVQADGTYSFPNVTPGTYSVVLGNSPAGSTTPPASPGADWVFTGENVGAGNGSDGSPDGTISGIIVGSSPVDNVNFGINRKPVAADYTAAVQPNPGGTVPVPVPSDAFSGSDLEDGAYPAPLTGRTIVVSTTTNGSFYYNGTLVNNGDVITGFNPTLLTVDPTAPGVTTPATHPRIDYSVVDDAGIASDAKTVLLPFGEPISISGTVYNDANGLSLPGGTVDGAAVQSASSIPLHANLFTSAGVFVATVPVDIAGNYLFTASASTDYIVTISSTPANSTSTPAGSASLPANWVNTGENIGTGPGSDGTPNGILPVSVGTGPVTSANFGIDQTPESDNKSGVLATQPASNAIIPLDGTLINAQPLTGSDPEDQPASGSLAGKSVAITSLPTNGEIWYNGSKIEFGLDGSTPPSPTNPFVITGLVASQLEIKLTGAGYTSTQFTYAHIDAAGVQDPSPATYALSFAPLPVTLIAFKAQKEGNQVELQWTTTSETNSGFFAVLRSLDGNNWQELGRVEAQGTSNVRQQYSFVDPMPVTGTSLYRLKMVDLDGSYAYSVIRDISFASRALVTVYPNPASKILNINTQAPYSSIDRVEIIAADSRYVYLSRIINTDRIDISNLPSGVYVLLVRFKDGNRVSQKFIVSK